MVTKESQQTSLYDNHDYKNKSLDDLLGRSKTESVEFKLVDHRPNKRKANETCKPWQSRETRNKFLADPVKRFEDAFIND